MKFLYLILLLLVVTVSGIAQNYPAKQRIKVDPPICYASGEIEKGYIPPPEHVFNSLKSGEKPTSDIRVNYSLFPQEAKDAFDYAVSVWEYLIDSPIPIYLQANWRSMGGNVLGSCGPSEYLKNFENAPQNDIYYPIAIVEKLTGTEIYDENFPDMEANFNKNVDWYFGTDGKTPDSLYDFVSVVMHEIGHGLGITGFFFIEGSNGAYAYEEYGDASTFDLLVMDVNDRLLLDQSFFPNQSIKLKNALVSNGLFANSPAGKKLGGGYKPRLYAPQIWDDGSSVYHLNDATYPHSSENSLMTHAIGKGEAVHNPGPIVEGLMADMGWKHIYIDHLPVKDKEELQPLTFNVKLKSDYPLDTSKLHVFYSIDGFQNDIDSAALVPQEIEELFSVVVENKKNWQNLSYYIKTADKMERIFTLPRNVPQSYFTVNFGPDNIQPEITHDEIPYFLLQKEDLKIYANVDDNLGVDTVYISYSINNIPQQSFGLTPDSTETLYSGIFNFDKNALNDGDEITYNIIARDASVAQNQKSVPFKDKFSFKIEKLFEPVYQYQNDFNAETRDFVLSDFSVFTETGFVNGALHSPHPYPAPEKNNEEFNFITILKYPVILGQSGFLAFDEVVLVEPGTSGTQFGDFEFWDFVIVEASKDGGKNWHPLDDGYDSRTNFNWNSTYNENIVEQNSTAVGTSEMFVNRNINLLDNEFFVKGDTLLIRFRLYSDPFAYGWGWAIDNLLIEQVVSTKDFVLSPGNIRFYPNPVSRNLNIDIQANENIQKLQIDIFNVYGQKVKSIQKNNFSGILTEQIDFSEFDNGMYLVSVRENGLQVFTAKIVK